MNLAIAFVASLLLQDPPATTPAAEPAPQASPAAPPTGTEPTSPNPAPQDPAPIDPATNPASSPASNPATPQQPATTPATGSPSTDPATIPATTPATTPATGETKADPASSAAPASSTPSTAPEAATQPATTDDMPPITEQDLADVLELAGMNAVNSLEREVKSLQQTLDGLVLADDDSVVKIQGAKGSEDDLETFGVDDAVARQVRRLLDEVKSKRAKLALLDLRGASSNSPNDGLRGVADVAASDPANRLHGATGATAQAPQADANAKGAPNAATPAADETDADVLEGSSPDPQREALIAFRDRDTRTVLELLGDTPVLRMKPLTLWAYGSCLLSERRFADAKAAFTRLADDRDHPQLAHGAKKQLERITFLENALVGEGPSTETKK